MFEVDDNGPNKGSNTQCCRESSGSGGAAERVSGNRNVEGVSFFFFFFAFVARDIIVVNASQWLRGLSYNIHTERSHRCVYIYIHTHIYIY